MPAHALSAGQVARSPPLAPMAAAMRRSAQATGATLLAPCITALRPSLQISVPRDGGQLLSHPTTPLPHYPATPLPHYPATPLPQR